MNPKVNVIVCTYNNKSIIDKLLLSLERQTYKNFTCTIVDDHSTDGSLTYLHDMYSWVKVVSKHSNTGPSASRNLGIQLTSGSYLAFLDSDVELRKDWMMRMVQFMDKDSSIAIVASQLIYASDHTRINSAGGTMTKTGIGKDIGINESSKKFSKLSEVLYACSAAMMVRRSALKKLGMFDDAYFYGHEDTDLGWRARLLGFKVVYNPRAVAYHRVSTTISSQPRMVAFHGVKNRIRSMIKNYEITNLVKYGVLYGMLLGGDIILHNNRIAKVRAIGWNVLHIVDTLKERSVVQRKRKVSDQELFRLFDNSLY